MPAAKRRYLPTVQTFAFNAKRNVEALNRSQVAQKCSLLKVSMAKALSPGRARRALAPVERVWAIAIQALVAAVVWVAVAESAVQELEAERIG